MRLHIKSLIIAAIAALYSTAAAEAQDKYDRVLESCGRIAAETGIGMSRDMKGEVDRIRNMKIEMPKEEKLKGARNRIAKTRERLYGPQITKANGKGRAASANGIGKSKSKVSYGNAGQGGTAPRVSGPTAAQKRDKERIDKAVEGAKDVHKGTHDSYNKTQNEIERSDKFLSSYNPDNYVAKGGGRVDDDPGFKEKEPVKNISGVGLFDGLDNEAEAAPAQLRTFDIEELFARFEKDENSLDSEELDYMTAYLDNALAELEKEKETENNQNSAISHEK